LRPDEAIGPRADGEFVLARGKEQVVEAVFGGGARRLRRGPAPSGGRPRRDRRARGQAFTDRPWAWTGRLADLLALDLAPVAHRAVFVAGMNAVLRRLGVAAGTVHCVNNAPARCGPVLSQEMARRYGDVRVGLIGLQPAILRALAERFGPHRVRAVDLNPEQVGAVIAGVPVWDGATHLERLVETCDVGLATGSSLVNNTMDGLLDRFRQARKPLVFFGNTVSGAAAILGLDRLCPFGQ
jgi:hypothetical protein